MIVRNKDLRLIFSKEFNQTYGLTFNLYENTEELLKEIEEGISVVKGLDPNKECEPIRVEDDRILVTFIDKVEDCEITFTITYSPAPENKEYLKVEVDPNMWTYDGGE